MLTRSRIIGDSSALCGEILDEPLPRGIPMNVRFAIAAAMEVELLRDANLSSENRYLSLTEVTFSPGDPDFTVDVPDFETPAMASVKVSAEDRNPQDVAITNLSLLIGKARDEQLAIAFYDDNPQKGRLSWTPTGRETLLLGYDRAPATDPAPTQAAMTLTDSYLGLLVLLLAAQFKEMLDQPIGKVLESRISRGLKQWETFVKQVRQQGVAQKSSWQPSRYGGSNQWRTGDGFRIS